MKEEEIGINDTLLCVFDGHLPDNDCGPDVTINTIYTPRGIMQCACGQNHIDVGLPSMLNYVTCYKCKEVLANGDKIAWCHPSRFQIVKPEAAITKPNICGITKF